MPNILDATEMFMRAAGQLDDPPQFNNFNCELRKLRRILIAEEFLEYYDCGEYKDDLVETIDGLLDIIVIAWGSILAYIGPEKAQACAAEVVRSNLSKIDGTLGPLVKREDGKILKPQGFMPPDIKGILESDGS